MYDFSKEACKDNAEKQIIRIALLCLSGKKAQELTARFPDEFKNLKNMNPKQLSNIILHLLDNTI